MKRLIGYYLGNFLMVAAVIGLVFVYYPVISLYLNPPKIKQDLPLKGFFLTIPKINAQAPIIPNVDPWNEEEYLAKLQQGIAEASGSVEVGQKGEIYLFAHSSEEPWDMTRINTAFLRLGDLKTGDRVVITKDGRNFIYSVYDKKELWPSQVSYLNDLQKNGEPKEATNLPPLILQTCTPIGTSLKRLLVFAKPV